MGGPIHAQVHSWFDWPASRRPARAGLAATVILLMVVVVAAQDPWLGVLCGVVLLLSTGEVLLPTRYAVSERGVRVMRALTNRTHIWSRFTAYREVPEGFVLEGRGSRPAIRRYRTLLLRCADQRRAIAGALAHHIEPSTAAEASCAN